MRNLIYLGIFTLLVLVGCKTESVTPEYYAPNLPAESYDYASVIEGIDEVNFPIVQIANPFNPGSIIDFGNISFCGTCLTGSISQDRSITSNESATLGRVLFYDRNLSKNNAVSCASCHQQEKGFADDQALSIGFGNKKTIRNSMALANPVLNNSFFWDSRESDLETLVMEPIQNHIEMGISDINELAEKIKSIPYYKELYINAFGPNAMNIENTRTALSDFIKSTFKSDSRFDEGMHNDFEDYREIEKLGMALFFSNDLQCAGCHSGANFSAPDGLGGAYGGTTQRGTTNTGLDASTSDPGRNDGSFKIPSLRNIALTAPYMHDGRFETLREALEFYNSGIQNHPNLDERLKKNGSPLRMNLTYLELDALEAFLNTLTSQSIQTDDKLSNPFVD